MIKTIINIKGMHCRSCELLITEELKKIPGVSKINISYKKGQAEIFSDQDIDLKKVTLSITKAGYEVGSDKEKPLISRKFQDYKDLLINLIILLLLYLILKKFGLFNIGAGSSQNSGNYLAVVVIGLTAGFSTCMALVGGLILGLSSSHAEKYPEAKSMEKFRPHLFFNLGRITSFIFFGGLIGLIGKAFQLSSFSLGLLIIIVGIVMLFLGLKLIEIFPRLSNGRFTLPSGLAKILGLNRQQKEYSHKNAFVLGALTFFLPCGFTQAMQVYAVSTGNFFSGALIMGLFALGTAPGLLSIGGLTSVLKGIFAQRFFKFVGVVVITLSILNISNGLHLIGLNFGLGAAKNQTNKNDSNVTIENGVQIVRMNQLSNGYSPNNFTIKQGLPTKWIINSKDPNSCASSIISPKLGIRKYLTGGENIINFTPNETGTIKFSCSMGMYNGYFNVVENNDAPNNTSQDQSANNEQPKNENYSNALILNAVYTYKGDIQPKEFSTKVNQPTILKIEVKEDGYGCMGSIVIPGLNNEIEYLKKGQNLAIQFTPTQKGTYKIACSMGSPRGYIKVE